MTSARSFVAALSFVATVLWGGVTYADAIKLEGEWADAAANPGRPVKAEIDGGQATPIPARIEMTDQGNGTLSLPGVALRIWDDHDDGLVYATNPLRLYGAHLAGPKTFDLIVTGIARHTGEKESDPSWDEAVLFIYRLNCKLGRFEKIFSANTFDLDLGNSTIDPYKCE